VKALKISFLMALLVNSWPLLGQESLVDPVLLDPAPSALSEPTMPEPVPMPEPAFPEEAKAAEASNIAAVPLSEQLKGASTLPTPLPRAAPFWECRLPSGGFVVKVPDIVTVSLQEYVVDDHAKVYEVMVSTRSAVVARFYHEERLSVQVEVSMAEPLVEGRLALERAQSLISTGRHVREQEVQDHGLPNKQSLDTAVAPSATYRLKRKADVLALYQSAKAAWRNGVEGLFQLAE
jgi:hypothetical protein